MKVTLVRTLILNNLIFGFLLSCGQTKTKYVDRVVKDDLTQTNVENLNNQSTGDITTEDGKLSLKNTAETSSTDTALKATLNEKIIPDSLEIAPIMEVEDRPFHQLTYAKVEDVDLTKPEQANYINFGRTVVRIDYPDYGLWDWRLCSSVLVKPSKKSFEEYKDQKAYIVTAGHCSFHAHATPSTNTTEAKTFVDYFPTLPVKMASEPKSPDESEVGNGLSLFKLQNPTSQEAVYFTVESEIFALNINSDVLVYRLAETYGEIEAKVPGARGVEISNNIDFKYENKNLKLVSTPSYDVTGRSNNDTMYFSNCGVESQSSIVELNKLMPRAFITNCWVKGGSSGAGYFDESNEKLIGILSTQFGSHENVCGDSHPCIWKNNRWESDFNAVVVDIRGLGSCFTQNWDIQCVKKYNQYLAEISSNIPAPTNENTFNWWKYLEDNQKPQRELPSQDLYYDSREILRNDEGIKNAHSTGVLISDIEGEETFVCNTNVVKPNQGTFEDYKNSNVIVLGSSDCDSGSLENIFFLTPFAESDVKKIKVQKLLALEKVTTSLSVYELDISYSDLAALFPELNANLLGFSIASLGATSDLAIEVGTNEAAVDVNPMVLGFASSSYKSLAGGLFYSVCSIYPASTVVGTTVQWANAVVSDCSGLRNLIGASYINYKGDLNAVVALVKTEKTDKGCTDKKPCTWDVSLNEWQSTYSMILVDVAPYKSCFNRGFDLACFNKITNDLKGKVFITEVPGEDNYFDWDDYLSNYYPIRTPAEYSSK